MDRNRQVSVTELRQNLPTYLASVHSGSTIEVTSHGKVIARIVPSGDASEEARKKLRALRGKAFVGDVVSPLDVEWDAER